MLKRAIACILILVSVFSLGWSQLESNLFQASFFAQKINKENIRTHLYKLASDEMEGRETGTEGLEKAAQYISSQFSEWGLKSKSPGNYFQEIRLSKISWEEITCSINGESVNHMLDFISFPDWNNNRPYIEIDQVLFLGYGIEDENYNDYARVSPEGRTIMILDGEPYNKDSISYVSGSMEASEWSNGWEKKLKTAWKHKVETVIIVDPDIKKTINNNRGRVLNNRLKMGKPEFPNYPNNIIVSSTVAKKIIGNKDKAFIKNRRRIVNTGVGRPLRLDCSMILKQHLLKYLQYAKNIFAFIEGSDPILKDELVVLSAHYDHLGKRGKSIFYGADDNASGTSTVMEVMRIFSKVVKAGKAPKRSIAVILFAGEEKGLMGSRYYVENPLHPLEQTVVDINVDMVGRVDAKHRGNPYYIYVIGSDRLSNQLHVINEEINNTFTQLSLDYKYNAKDDPNRFYYRSDHYNFAKNGIPVIFFFNGTHEDYHRPSDTPDKINFDKMQTIAQLIFYNAWEIANRKEKLKVDVIDTTTYDR